MVLSRNGASPIPPQSDDENKKKDDDAKKDDAKNGDTEKGGDKDAADKDKPGSKDDKKDKDKKKDAEKLKPTVIDLAGIGNRILSLPIPARNYIDLSVGKSGVLFLAEGPAVGRPSEEGGAPIVALWRFTTEKRLTEEMLSDLTAYDVSLNGEKLFYARHDSWVIVPTADLKPGSPDALPGTPLHNGAMFAMLDARAEWKQMYRETWHLQRDFLYDPHLHGLDLAKIQAKYQPYLDGLASRAEFTYLCDEMLGEIQIGHMFVRGPRAPADAPKPGLLGADYTIDHDRYRFAKIYNGQNWTPSLTAPLTLPGINIVEGDYLLAVNARELHATDNIDSFFDGTAGKQTVLRIAKSADGSGGARCHRGAGGFRARSAQSRLDRLQPAQGRRACPGARSPTSTCRTPAAPATATSIATSILNWISRPWCSMSATTRAASSRTTSSMCWVKRG